MGEVFCTLFAWKKKEGVAIDQNATSDYAKGKNRQAVKIAKPSDYERISHNEESVKQNSDRGAHAPTFYSHRGRVIDGIKQNKMSANGVVSYLKGKGVKDEEIKWSGIG